jgi:tetratricopeptide (TPR) repeat protein
MKVVARPERINSRNELMMAETITLRTYLNELSAKLEQGSSTAVISHCRYILQHYPQNVEAYRLLGKALLQKGQDEGLTEHFEEAAEVFRRVLSVLPNDHIAHLGMSEIRAYEEALDAAIWHLERAHEQMPGNQVLQEALRELYVKRDGEDRAPEKIHLTRSALARQYIAGQLYDQALTELRTALEQDPGRIDLQVLLAETLWNSQHPIEAGEVAVQILKKLPNCLAANRILAQLWLDNERPTDAQLFLERLEALDPYTAASVVRPDSEIHDPNLLRQLDYSAEAQAVLSSETPDWVQQLNDLDTDFGAESPLQAPPPDKDLAQRSRQAGTSVPGEQPEPQTAPAWMSDPGSAFPSPEVPDWFVSEPTESAAEAPGASAQADWPSSQLPFGEGPVKEETLAPEIPDWFMQGAAEVPPESAEQTALQADWLADGDDMVDQGPLPSLDELMGVEPAGQSPIEADWLMDEDSAVPPSLGDLEQPGSQEQPISEADWLIGTAEEEASVDLFEELGRLESAGAIPEASDQRSSSGFTDLLAGIETAQVPSDTSEESGDVEPIPPDWLDTFEGEAPSTDEAMLQSETPSSELPDLEMLFSVETPASMKQQGETEEDEAFWASFDEPLPNLADEAIIGDAPEAGPLSSWAETEEQLAAEDSDTGAPTDIQGDVTPEWQSQTGPSTMPGDTAPQEEAKSPASTDDWVSDLQGLDSIWLESERTPGESDAAMSEAESEPALPATEEEHPPADMEDWLGEAANTNDASLLDVLTPANEELEAESEGQIEPASELPDWMGDAAPIDAPPEEAGPETPELPAVDVDLMALFDAQDSAPMIVESWESLEAAEELQTSETQEDAEQDWLRPAATDDDWLGAFAKFGEAESSTQDVAPEAQLARDDELFAATGDAREEALTGSEAGGPDDWLTEVPDLEIEAVSTEEPPGDAVSVLPFCRPMPSKTSCSKRKRPEMSRKRWSLWLPKRLMRWRVPKRVGLTKPMRARVLWRITA